METRPGSEPRVLVTRASRQAEEFSRVLRELGARPIELPLIVIEPPETWEQIDAAIARLTAYDWVLFTSTNAAAVFLDRLEALGGSPPRRAAAVGSATAKALSVRGLEPRIVAEESSGEGLFAALEAVGVRGKRFLLPRADRGREELVRLLTAAGATVDVVTAYRTVDARVPPHALDPLRRGEIDVVTFASPSAVRRFVALAPDAPALVSRALVAVIGPTTRDACERLGVRVDIQPEQHTIPALAQAITERCNRRP